MNASGSKRCEKRQRTSAGSNASCSRREKGYSTSTASNKSCNKNRELERLKAEREFYFKRVEQIEEQNRILTESATKYSLLSQKLERELAEASIKYQKLERELTEAATNETQ